jgi:hypothetical protein
MKLAKWFVVVSSVAVIVGVGSASADSPGITRGDAEALFNASGTGGAVIAQHDGVVEGAPASPARIFPGQRFQGVHICRSDWHAMFTSLGLTDTVFGGGAHTVREASQILAGIGVTYELDGRPVALRTTPVTPWLIDLSTIDPDATVGFAEHVGTIFSPDDLTVGSHIENMRLDEHGVLDDFGFVTFFVDAAGTGVCL